MQSRLRYVRLTAYLLLLLSFVVLLEIFSYLILKIDHTYDQFVFEKSNSIGVIRPDKNQVLPMKRLFSGEWVNPEFNVHIRTNNFGLRENFDHHEDGVKIAFFGDSFTFGHGVEVDQRYSNLVGRNYSDPNKVVSFSYANGFQPEHYEFYLRNHPNLMPKIAVVGLFLGNDLGPDLLQTKYDFKNNILSIPDLLITEYGQRINNPEIYIFPVDKLIVRSHFVTLLMKYGNKLQATNWLIRDSSHSMEAAVNSTALESGDTNLKENRAIQSLVRINELLKERGTKLVVLIIPQFFYTNINGEKIDDIALKKYELINSFLKINQNKNLLRQVSEVCSQLNLDCLDISQDLSPNDYYLFDGHWKATGHYKAAKALMKKIGM